MDGLRRIDPSRHWVWEPGFSISVWGRRRPSRGPPRSTLVNVVQDVQHGGVAVLTVSVGGLGATFPSCNSDPGTRGGSPQPSPLFLEDQLDTIPGARLFALGTGHARAALTTA